MNELLLPILIVVVASLFQGTFGLSVGYTGMSPTYPTNAAANALRKANYQNGWTLNP